MNPPITDGFPLQRSATQSFDVFFDLRWTDIWANIRDASDLRRHYAQNHVTVMDYHKLD